MQSIPLQKNWLILILTNSAGAFLALMLLCIEWPLIEAIANGATASEYFAQNWLWAILLNAMAGTPVLILNLLALPTLSTSFTEESIRQFALGGQKNLQWSEITHVWLYETFWWRGPILILKSSSVTMNINLTFFWDGRLVFREVQKRVDAQSLHDLKQSGFFVEL